MKVLLRHGHSSHGFAKRAKFSALKQSSGLSLGCFAWSLAYLKLGKGFFRGFVFKTVSHDNEILNEKNF